MTRSVFVRNTYMYVCTAIVMTECDVRRFKSIIVYAGVSNVSLYVWIGERFVYG